MTLIPSFTPAILVLADGSVFHGQAIGALGHACGEVVFNTAMSGYQEILTDPSYARQLVTLTYPHIGNVGCNHEDFESRANFAAGLIIRDLPIHAENWRMQESLGDYLKKHDMVGIAGLDTRRLTRHLRERGAQAGCIMAGDVDVENALSLAKATPSLVGMDLAKRVSVDQPYEWTQGLWGLQGYLRMSEAKYHVVAYDFGIKRNILRMLTAHGCKVTVVPAETTAAQALRYAPDGIFLSNGPGDPQPCEYALRAISEFIAKKMPLFGICLGHQLLALAAGATTRKMKFGHHGANHPVKDLASGKVLITSQNHGFMVDKESLPACLTATHVSLFDGSLQGVRHNSAPAFSFQGHPEASPGPGDVEYLFAQFVHLMEGARNGGKHHA